MQVIGTYRYLGVIGNYDDDEGRVRNKRSYREKGTLHCTVAGIFKVSKDLS